MYDLANISIKMEAGGWRNDSAVKSKRCSCRELGSDSHYAYGRLQLSATSVPEDLLPSSDLCTYYACVWCTNMHVGKSTIHIRQTNTQTNK